MMVRVEPKRLFISGKNRKTVTVQNRSERNRIDRKNMIHVCGNPIVADDFHGFSHRNCEGTEQLRKTAILQAEKRVDGGFDEEEKGTI